VVEQLEVGEAEHQAQDGDRQHGHYEGQASGDATAHAAHRPPPSPNETPVLEFIFAPVGAGILRFRSLLNIG